MIPLILRLKKQMHKDIANAQDMIIEETYAVFENAVLHGGTAIWRCYKGNRFSEDIDAYIPKDNAKIELLFKNLEKKGFIIKKKKIGKNSLFSKLQLNRTFVRLEVLFKKADGSLREYELSDGNLITVYALTPEEIIEEKVNAYLKRLKIRDLYDIFFLLRHVKEKDDVKNNIKRLISNFKKPVDEKELGALILEGITPDSEKMMAYIKSWI